MSTSSWCSRSSPDTGRRCSPVYTSASSSSWWIAVSSGRGWSPCDTGARASRVRTEGNRLLDRSEQLQREDLERDAEPATKPGAGTPGEALQELAWVKVART